jgi:hypothetical protein
MWKALFIVAALSVSASRLDAAQPDNGRRIEKTQRDDARRDSLRRDVERISQEIYRRGNPPPRQPQPQPRR